MTTSEQLLADAGWRRRHSVYTVWALLFGLGFISLIYTGVRAKENKWVLWGIAYGVVAIGSFALLPSGPEDPEAAEPLIGTIATFAWLIVWIVSAIHVFQARKQWLSWKAVQSAQAPWYQASTTASASSVAADLSAIGLDDPVTDFLASPTPSAAATSASSPLLVQPTTDPATGLIDLNTATVEELTSVPGIDVATAHRIVEERERRGGFESVDEAAEAAALKPHVRSRLQQRAEVSRRKQPQRRGSAGRIVDI